MIHPEHTLQPCLMAASNLKIADSLSVQRKTHLGTEPLKKLFHHFLLNCLTCDAKIIKGNAGGGKKMPYFSDASTHLQEIRAGMASTTLSFTA